MAKIQEFQKAARARGYSQTEIDSYLLKGAKSKQGKLGKLSDVALAPFRYLAPSRTKLVEKTVQGTAMNLRDLFGGDMGAIKGRTEKEKLRPIDMLLPPMAATNFNTLGGAAAREQMIDMGLTFGTGKLAQKALSPVLKKLPGFAKPSAVVKEAGKQKGAVWNKLLKVAKQAEKKGVRIKTAKVLDELKPLVDDAIEINDEAALKEIADIQAWVASFGDEMTPSQAVKLGARIKDKAGLWSKTTGELTRTVTKPGKQAAFKESGALSSNVRAQSNKMSQLLDEYGELATAQTGMAKPFKGYQMGAIASSAASVPLGLLGYAIGGAPAAAAASLVPGAITVAATPAGRYYAKQAAGKALPKAMQYAGIPAASWLNYLLSGGTGNQ